MRAQRSGCTRVARRALAATGDTVDVERSGARGEAAAIARAGLARGVRRFIAVGGDGTAFEVLNGLFPEAVTADPPPVLGFLPLGTGNSFVRDFTREGAAYCREAIAAGRSRRVDLLRVRHRTGECVALGVVSLGYGARVAALVNRRLKPFGKIGYSIGVVAEVARLEPESVRLTMDADLEPRAEEMVLLCACNNRHVGGDMMMAPEARIDDGELDLVTVGRVGRLDLLRTFPRIFAGTHTSHPAVTVRRGRAIAFEMVEETDVMIDGESMRLRLESVEVARRALTVAL